MNYSSNRGFHIVSIKRGMQMMTATHFSAVVCSLLNPSPTQQISREDPTYRKCLPLDLLTIKLNLIKNRGSLFLLKFHLFPKFTSCQY